MPTENRISEPRTEVKRYRFKGAAGEYVYSADFDRVAAERDGLQLSLTTADQTIDDLQTAIARRNQRIEELVAEIATVRQGPCKMIVGDELP